jgi:hypothetical protein
LKLRCLFNIADISFINANAVLIAFDTIYKYFGMKRGRKLLAKLEGKNTLRVDSQFENKI